MCLRLPGNEVCSEKHCAAHPASVITKSTHHPYRCCCSCCCNCDTDVEAEKRYQEKRAAEKAGEPIPPPPVVLWRSTREWGVWIKDLRRARMTGALGGAAYAAAALVDRTHVSVHQVGVGVGFAVVPCGMFVQGICSTACICMYPVGCVESQTCDEQARALGGAAYAATALVDNRTHITIIQFCWALGMCLLLQVQ